MANKFFLVKIIIFNEVSFNFDLKLTSIIKIGERLWFLKQFKLLQMNRCRPTNLQILIFLVRRNDSLCDTITQSMLLKE